MDILEPTISLTDDAASNNEKFHRELLSKLEERQLAVKQGGGERAVKAHRERGKLLPRERIEKLLDVGSPFLEICPLAAWGVYEDDIPSAGVVAGLGVVHGVRVMVVCNDATVKGGTYFPLTVKKHLRAQAIAEQCNLPCLYLVDSGGAFLPMQDEVFPDQLHFGRIFFNQARLSAKGIPQLAVVLGSCTAGGAYVPAMADESVIVRGNGTIFLAGPPLVEAATGERVTDQELGGAEVHTQISGVADHIAENEEDALAIARNMVAALGPQSYERPARYGRRNAQEPLFPVEDILKVLPTDTTRNPFDIREIIARIVDGSAFHEFKRLYGKTLVCGFATIYGYPVGIIGNNGILMSESALKGAHFIQLCESRKIPLLFLQNITGFMVGKKAESEGIAKHGAKMVTAVSTCTVPKLTVIVGGSYGAGNYGMCGRAYDPNFLWMWPNAKISVMGGEQAAGVLMTVKNGAREKLGQEPLNDIERAELVDPIREQFERQSDPYYSTARLWDDGIISPLQTREVLGLALEVCSHHEPLKSPDGFGLFRM